jgi:DNA polymerase III sliding clamp (beta) subunit (PCNA family)
MKVKIDKELFLLKLQKLVKFVPAKSVIPAFGNIKVSVKNDSIEMIAGDGNMQCKVVCDAKSKEEFVFCVQGKLFLKTINSLKENEVTLSILKNGKLEVKSGKFKSNISMDCTENDFPVMNIDAISSEMNISQFKLLKSLKLTEKFVDDKSANENFKGVNIALIDRNIVFTGLDNSSMCRASMAPISINQWNNIVMPTETAAKIVGMLEEKGEASIAHNGEKIIVSTPVDSGNYFEIISVSSNIAYPNSEAVFKKRGDKEVEINTLELKDALKRLSVYSSADTAPVITLELNGDTLKMTYEDINFGHNCEDEITVRNDSGVSTIKHFNGDKFVDILNCVETNEFVFNFHDVTAPGFPNFINPKENVEIPDQMSFLLQACVK